MAITKNTWSRWPKDGTTNYELSSHGDTRYSPLFATLQDGRTIEEAYQLDIKGYRKHTNDWKQAKGKPSLSDLTIEQQYLEFRKLFVIFLRENPELKDELIHISTLCVNFTDMFAKTKINQARAYSEIINAIRAGKLKM